MADPAFGELGTVVRVPESAASLSSTISNVEVGDLLIAVMQRVNQHNCTGVACTSPSLTFTKLATALSENSGFSTELWAALATTQASSMVITASYSDSWTFGAMFTARYTSGVSSITPNNTTVHSTLASSSTNRTNSNMTTTVRTLMLVFGTEWDYYYTKTPATNWTERLDSNTNGTDTSQQYLYERIADAGTYPSGNYATADTADSYISGIVAFPVTTTTLPVFMNQYRQRRI